MATFMPDPKPSTFRKIAAAMWRKANDPSIYGSVDVDATRLLEAIERLRAATGVRLSVTHMVARAVALTLRKYPETNAKVRFWGKVERRSTVDLFLQVSTDGGQDLSGTRIERADEKSAIELAKEISEKAERIRRNDDPALKKSRGLFGWLPWWLCRPLLWVSDLLVNELHVDLSGSGMPRDAFGSAMITSVGMLGIDTAFAPLTPIARCAYIVCVTEVKDRPVAVDKRVEVRPILRLCATFDHRIIDGAHGAKISREVSRLLENPELLVEGTPDAETLRAGGPAPTPAPTPAGKT